MLCINVLNGTKPPWHVEKPNFENKVFSICVSLYDSSDDRLCFVLWISILRRRFSYINKAWWKLHSEIMRKISFSVLLSFYMSHIFTYRKDLPSLCTIFSYCLMYSLIVVLK